MKDELNGLDKAVSAVLGQRTMERNQLLISTAKTKVTKPEELVRLYDLLLQVNFITFLDFPDAFLCRPLPQHTCQTLTIILKLGRIQLIFLIYLVLEETENQRKWRLTKSVH